VALGDAEIHFFPLRAAEGGRVISRIPFTDGGGRGVFEDADLRPSMRFSLCSR
jgi:hypothetical protein